MEDAPERTSRESNPSDPGPEPDYFQLNPSQPSPQVPQMAPPNHVWSSLLDAANEPRTSQSMPTKLADFRQPFPLPSLLRPPSSIAHVSPNKAASEPSVPDADKYTPLHPSLLIELMHNHPILDHPAPEHVLVLDIRPTSAFSRSHLRGSVNVCAPTTLLRRSEFTVERLEDQIFDDDTDRSEFRRWMSYTRREPTQTSGPSSPSSLPAKSTSWIVVLDTDSTKPTSLGRSSAGGGGPSLMGLLRKFDAASYGGMLCWLRGGFQSLAALPEAVPLLEHSPVGTQPRAASHNLPRVRGLSLEAFCRKTTSNSNGGSGEEIQATNPFFDNIRQNLELSCGITDIVPLDMHFSDPQLSRLPKFLFDLAAMDPSKRAHHLAEQFFVVEKCEQQRLQSVMQRHSQESSLSLSNPAGTMNTRAPPPLASVHVSSRAAFPRLPSAQDSATDSFPLSITAALERGHDHRYRNFWPFEHSRVKFKSPASRAEYINASYVNPLRAWGAHRVYVATQAPLPTTFCAFWAVVWEQKVPAIIMLAREFESGRLQCDNYWDTPHAGPFDVHVVQKCVLTSADLGHVGEDGLHVLVRRTIEVRHKDLADEPVHSVQHYQFLAWPDHSVPETPDLLLDMIRLVHAETDTASDAPIVVHCSAGIGRTGAHILIDSVSTFLSRVHRVLETGHDDADGLSLAQAHEYWNSSNDLVYEALMVMREQRMSMVETVRQYVFVYKAVIASLLT